MRSANVGFRKRILRAPPQCVNRSVALALRIIGALPRVPRSEGRTMSDRTAVKFYQADVFTDTVFGGNPVAVVPEADGLSDVEMQKIAREMNLSETVFVLKPTTKAAQYRLRFFTPTQEIAFAGHPVVGAFYVLVHVGIVTLYEPLTRIYQETHVGVFTVEITAREGRIQHIMMSQPAPEFLGVVEPLRDLFEVAKAVGVPKTTITGTGLPVEIVSTGFPVMVVPVRTLTAVSKATPNITLINSLCTQHKAQGLMIFTTVTVERTPSSMRRPRFRLSAPAMCSCASKPARSTISTSGFAREFPPSRCRCRTSADQMSRVSWNGWGRASRGWASATASLSLPASRAGHANSASQAGTICARPTTFSGLE